jgi:integration host factor subunit alpha
MTKADITENVHANVGGFSKRESADIVDAVFEIIKQALADHREVKISRFGNFAVQFKRERVGRNPKTGEPMPIRARWRVKFKASPVLRSILNSYRDVFQGDGTK